MTGREVAGLILRLWGLMWIINVLAALPQTAIVPGANETAGIWNRLFWIAMNLLLLLVQLAIGAGLFFHGQWVADRLFEHYDRPLNASLSARDLQIIAFSVLGLYLIVLSIQDLAYVFYRVQTKPRYEQVLGAYFSEDYGDRLFKGGINLIFGSLLLIGRKGFASIWHVIHPMSEPEEQSADELGE